MLTITTSIPIDEGFSRRVDHADVKRAQKFCFHSPPHVAFDQQLLQAVRDELSLVLGSNVAASDKGSYTSADGRSWLGHVTILRNKFRHRFYVPHDADGIKGGQQIELHLEDGACDADEVTHSLCQLFIQACKVVMRERRQKGQ